MGASQTMNFGAATGDRHYTSSRWANGGGVAEHPLQRLGMVGRQSTLMLGRESAQTWAGIGDGPPAGVAHSPLPPVLNFAGSPRDPRFLV
jgi:hypothetical protein